MKKVLDFLLFAGPVAGFMLGFDFLYSLLNKFKLVFNEKLTSKQVDIYFSIVRYDLPIIALLIAMMMWSFFAYIRILYILKLKKKDLTKTDCDETSDQKQL